METDEVEKYCKQFKLGDLVQPTEKSGNTERRYRIIGRPHWQSGWFMPVEGYNEEKPFYYNGEHLEKSKPLVDGDICPICQEIFHGKEGCECQNSEPK